MSVPSNLIPKRVTQLPSAPAEATDLNSQMLVVYNGVTYQVNAASITNPTRFVPVTRDVIAGDGLTGGGTLGDDVTLNADLSDATPEGVYQTGSAGVSLEVSRADHKHPAVDLSDDDQVDGILGLASGGTAKSLTPEAGAIVWSGADGLYVGPAGVAGQVLVSNGANEYRWSSALVVTDQPANYIYGGPESGDPGETSFRLLVNADLPDAIAGKTLDDCVIGGTTPAEGTFTAAEVESLQMDTNPPSQTDVEGLMYWNNDDQAKTLNIVMAAGGVVQQVGEEIYFRVKASSAITNGQVVMYTGAVGASGGVLAAPATGLDYTEGCHILGIATESIATNGWGYITHFGIVRGINTANNGLSPSDPDYETWAAGDILYYDPAHTGRLTKNVPAAPNPKVMMALITYSSANVGTVCVRPTSFPYLGSLANVDTTPPTHDDLLQYNTDHWKNTPASSVTTGHATSLAGGAANRIAYQSAADTTAFVVAPTVAGSVLQWSGSAYEWHGIDGGTF